MIQRIQTVFLIIALALMSMPFFIPFAIVITDEVSFTLLWNGYLTNNEFQQSLPLAILSVLIPVLIFITIFLYKKRPVQMRLCMFSMLLMIGLTGFVIWHVFSAAPNTGPESFGFSTVSPLMAAIFTWMAHRKILKDELLVKSLDRLR